MEYFNYFIFFPDGEKQEIFHPLTIGDFVDVNGNIYLLKDLNPRKIAYRVSGMKSETYFKETTFFYRLELLNRDEVSDEIGFNEFKKKDLDYEKIFNKLEKKLKKKK
jgi:hypothetical protein